MIDFEFEIYNTFHFEISSCQCIAFRRQCGSNGRVLRVTFHPSYVDKKGSNSKIGNKAVKRLLHMFLL